MTYADPRTLTPLADNPRQVDDDVIETLCKLHPTGKELGK